jgi:NAD(P)-dependent dehydrogenase (short-subunit alcohol dehydrogenase family)
MAQRVVITAAAGGIGRVIAEAFLARGDQVAVCDVDVAAVEQFRTANPQASAAVVDLADGDALDRWLDEAIGTLGGVDVLVNNAGTKGPTAYVEDVDPADWSACLTVSLDSHYRCARRVAPLLKQQRSGTIIEISSMAGMYGYGMRTPYAAAKWAIVGLTKSLAIELGPFGVTCNAICPGSVRGNRIDSVIAAEAAQRGVAPQVVADDYVAGQSIKRFVEPSEIADMCLFLSSSAARMVSGQAIGVDGHTETYHL